MSLLWEHSSASREDLAFEWLGSLAPPPKRESARSCEPDWNPFSATDTIMRSRAMILAVKPRLTRLALKAPQT